MHQTFTSKIDCSLIIFIIKNVIKFACNTVKILMHTYIEADLGNCLPAKFQSCDSYSPSSIVHYLVKIIAIYIISFKKKKKVVGGGGGGMPLDPLVTTCYKATQLPYKFIK